MPTDPSLMREFITIGQELMRWDRQVAYGHDFARVATSPPSIAFASPGFLGHDYKRIVVLGQNPGEGSGRATAHRRWDELMSAWTDEGTTSSYDAAFAFYRADFLQVPIWTSWVAPVLAVAGLSVENIAYLNLSKSATVANKSPGRRIYQADWAWTRRQLELLSPAAVLAGGLEVGRQLRKFWSSPPFEVRVQNRIRSQSGSDRTRQATELGRWLAGAARRATAEDTA